MLPSTHKEGREDPDKKARRMNSGAVKTRVFHCLVRCSGAGYKTFVTSDGSCESNSWGEAKSNVIMEVLCHTSKQ